MGMGFWGWLASVIAFLAWPLVILYIVHQFKNEIVSFARRLSVFEWRNVRFTLAQDQALKEVGAKVSDRQGVRHEGSNINGDFRHYENGQIIADMKIQVAANADRVHVVFPLVFPYEVTSILPVGDIDVKVANFKLSQCTLHISPHSGEREI